MQGCVRTSTAGNAAGVVAQRAELTERLCQRPAADVPDEPTAPALPPRRWTVRSSRSSVPWVHGTTLSGVWRVVQRCNLRLRSARLRRSSPDPDYAAKETEVLRCFRVAAHAPADHVVLFLDEMGY